MLYLIGMLLAWMGLESWAKKLHNGHWFADFHGSVVCNCGEVCCYWYYMPCDGSTAPHLRRLG